jgi:hypothetical protein
VFKRSVAVLAFSFVLITLGAARLKAGDVDALLYTNGFATCPITGCASVDVNITDATHATITVTSLLDGYQFDNFGFNATDSSIGFASASGAIDTTDPKYGLAGPNNLNGYGSFMYVFDTGVNGGSTGSACVSGGAGCQFTINLTGTGAPLTASTFEVLSTGGAGDGTAEFAGHIAGSTCTGFVGGGDVTGESNTNGTGGSCGSTSTPEPRTLTLLGSGLLGLLIVGFRRRAFSSSFSAV